MGGKTSKVSQGTAATTVVSQKEADEAAKKQLISRLQIAKIVAIVAMVLAVVLPLATFSLFALIPCIPLALIGYDVFQLSSNALELAEDEKKQQKLIDKWGVSSATPTDVYNDLKPLITKNTLLTSLFLRCFPNSGCADLAVSHLQRIICPNNWA